MLKGKQGRFRQNLLGKRVDYSGRSVIVAGPELRIDQCGLPKMMALELFKPFVIGELIAREQAHNIRSATRMIETGETAVWDALDEVIRGKYVLLNRAPSLHRLSIQAFQPVLIEGRAIQLHPLVCKGFNADFDGDQMAVHLPLSDEAQAEARDIIAANKNLLKPADGTPILHIEQDMVLGCYYLTYDRPSATEGAPRAFIGINEALMAFDNDEIKLQTKIIAPYRGERRETTLGRLLFNEVFPEDMPFQDEPMTKKRLQQVMAMVYQKYGQAKTAEVADALKGLGFSYATFSGLSMGMGDFSPVEGMDGVIDEGEKRGAAISEQYEEGFITEEERYRLTVENWTKIDSRVQEMLAQQMVGQESTMAIAISSGARGNISQMKMCVGMLGVFSDASGHAIELPIKAGYIAGLNPLEYFTGTRGTRKALIDIALKTADAGYLTRRLVDVAQDVFTIEGDDSDELDPGFAMERADADEIGVSYASRLEGRYAAQDVKGHLKRGELISKETAEAIEADESLDGIKIMSVLSATSVHGVPQKSYGIDPATGLMVESHHPIGVIAAQSIGEPGTQLSLDSKHRSGAVVADDTAQGLSRVEELFEVRTPKGQAYLTDISGTANVWEEGDHYVIQVTANDKENVTYELGERKAKIKSGSDVAIGDVVASLEDGSEPLVAPMAGKAEVTDKAIIINPTGQSVVRYEIPGFKQLMVKDGDAIVAGQRLTNGSINLHELMRLQGVEATQRYIMNEILRIFAGQGQNIADKHLEIIVRQMFSRVQIEEAGDSEFVTGDVVSKLAVVEANDQLVRDGKEPAKVNQLLLGLIKASLSTDSFLSAASFQDTTRVLIAAATSGRVDKLYGLKENVILGRKIPVGTGHKSEDQLAAEAEEALAVEA
jgi:DNA-directed RNA polymerase subunit beta'